MLRGACHCGAIRVAFETAMAAEALAVRACACSFCRAHGARAATDPEGRLEIRCEKGAAIRYRFGLKTADFLICGRCGVYVAAVIDTAAGPRATLNVNVLEARDRFPADPPAADYEAEDRTARIARRERNWTPASICEI